MISKEQLHQIMPHATAENLERFCQPLNDSMQEYEINTPLRLAAFLANVAVESAELSATIENLNYSAEGLLRIFPTHFKPSEVQAYAHHPDKIANRAYANRLGNGDEASGDGWKYRGKGLLQDTGKTLQEATAKAIGCTADNLSLPLFACKAAGHTWKTKGCNELADAGNFRATCIRINGGENGLAQRIAFHNQAMKTLGI